MPTVVPATRALVQEMRKLKILENPFPAADPGALMQLGTTRTHALLGVHAREHPIVEAYQSVRVC